MHGKLPAVPVARVGPTDAIYLDFNKTSHLKAQIIRHATYMVPSKFKAD